MGLDPVAILEEDVAGGDRPDPLIQVKIEAALPETVPGIPAEGTAQGGEKVFSAVDEADPDFLLADPRIIAADGVEQIEDLARRLHSGIPAADHDETQEASTNSRAGFESRFLDPADDGRAQKHGVAHILHQEGMLGHTRYPAQVDDGAEGEDEVLETKEGLSGEGTGIDDQLTGIQVDRNDFPLENRGSGAEEPERVDDMAR